jgi:hypothetical protein
MFPKDVPEVQMHDVLVSGNERASSVRVRVPPRDAELALTIAKQAI